MELYFMPMVCSLATRIALYEAGLDGEVEFHEVGVVDKRMTDGGDFRGVNAKGHVPALVTRDGELLTEGAAVLQYVADLAPAAGLAPPQGGFERYRLQQWLTYVGMEIHRTFEPILNPAAPSEAKLYFRERVLPGKFDYLEGHLSTNEYLLGDRFTVADAYLATMLSTLASYAPKAVDLSQWPALDAYHQRMIARPAAARAIAEEQLLFQRAMAELTS